MNKGLWFIVFYIVSLIAKISFDNWVDKKLRDQKKRKITLKEAEFELKHIMHGCRIKTKTEENLIKPVPIEQTYIKKD